MAIATTNTKTTSWSKKVPKQGGKRNKGPTNEWSQSREEIYRRIQYKAGGVSYSKQNQVHKVQILQVCLLEQMMLTSLKYHSYCSLHFFSYHFFKN